MGAEVAEVVKGVENVVESDAGVGGLRLVERCAARSVHILPLQRASDARHILHHLHLQIDHLKDADAGVVVAHLFGFRHTLIGVVGQHTASFVPNAQNRVPVQRVGFG